MNYVFEWDPNKAKSNHQKHGVSFESAATVFQDARSISIYDSEHSSIEDRWITLGISASGVLLVVNHTFKEFDSHNAIRIFSSRKATNKETQQYLEG